MAFDNVSYFEARNLIFGTKNESHSLRKTKENYPNLREKNLNRFSKLSLESYDSREKN